MANAYMCDCCSNFYTHHDFKQSIPVVDLDGDEIFISMTFAKDGKVVHLCPKCRAAWQKAWDSRAVHKTTDPEHADKKCTLYEVEKKTDDLPSCNSCIHNGEMSSTGNCIKCSGFDRYEKRD